jgi:aldose 1-epimerase
MTAAMMVAWDRDWHFSHDARRCRKGQTRLQDGHEPDYQDVSAFRRGLATAWGVVSRSGALTAVTLLLLLTCVTALYMAHMGGHFHKLTTVVEHGAQNQLIVRPGGQDVLRQFRAERIGSVTPEFSSATLLPGDGMLLLQTTLLLPSRGDVPLLQSTPESNLAANGVNVLGSPFSVLAQSRAGSQWDAPLELLAGQPSSHVSNDVVPDGSRAVAHFVVPVDPANPSQQGIEVTVESSLTGHGLDLMISARNDGTSPRSLTLAWQPRFLAPPGGMSTLTVVTQSGSKSLPTEIALGGRNLDQTFTDLKRSFLSTGPEVRLRNRADGYTLRMTALTPSIRSLHVQAAKDGKSVLLAFSTAGAADGPETRTIVAPGATLQWRVRVEALAESTSPYSPSAQ